MNLLTGVSLNTYRSPALTFSPNAFNTYCIIYSSQYLLSEHTHKLIAEHNAHMHNQIECNERIKSKLNFLLARVSKSTFDAEQPLKLEKVLDVAISLSETTTLISKREPSNKNISKQLHFESIKKRRKHDSVKSVSKPSLEEKQRIKKFLNDDTDHLYCKKPKLF